MAATEGKMPATKIPGSAAESGSGKTDGSGEAINERFVRFLRRHHVLTLATVADGVPYCANAFYCYDKERNLIVFTSDPATRHAQEMERNPRVAASVVLETKIVGRVQGLQLCGTATRADEQAKRTYLKRFPYAALAELTLWAIEPDFMKLTDNTLGFGKKLIWNDKQESSS
ncbi:MAG: pyridoxamine 5'-phosphate oxidase family protein [Alistipes sp.]|nr:pyridoxamine 5'-phosphate oxidase family protein [Alistipes sp.]